MNLIAFLSAGCIAVSVFALYKEKSIAAAAVVFVSITLLVLALGGGR